VTFNSYPFLFVFLPIVVAGYYVLSRVFGSQKPALTWLVLASVVFYGTFGVGLLAVLVASVLVNFAIAALMVRQPTGSSGRKWLLALGILANLALLGTYKYTGFVAENINTLFGTHLKSSIAAYPVGLSFYTFIQIGFLIDAYVGQTERLSFLRYTLFGTFFPYITAGPIVRQQEVLEQLDTPVRDRTGVSQVAVGGTMFAMGLFKKAVLADSIAPYATTLFNTAAGHGSISTLDAWIGAFAYTLQLYFDFSGYTDMALGLGYMLGLRLPLNFNSPLRATSLVDFWRRWHMTMTRWFTNYIYTPITMRLMRRAAGKQYSEPARILLVLCLPILVTFLLVGLWHGAGWGFVIWGAIQGVGLAINLVWRELAAKFKLVKIPSPVGWALTMLTLVGSLLYFRAPNVDTANRLLGTMVGLGPSGGPSPAKLYGTYTLGSVTYVPVVFWVVLLLAIALLFPRNTQQLLADYKVGLPTIPSPEPRPWFALTWQPNVRWATAVAVMAGLALVYVGGPAPFLYYKF
jgi:D-alanyl-lipoteichoic acid acyltransferase DltB (MBOAT superfamily)